MDASRWQGPIWCSGQVDCRSIFGLLVQAFGLLALMESADPRLILLMGLLPERPCRLSGPRSDLFAITSCCTLRNLLMCYLPSRFLITVVKRA